MWKTVSQYGLISSSGSSVDAAGQEVGHRLNWSKRKQWVEMGCVPSDVPHSPLADSEELLLKVLLLKTHRLQSGTRSSLKKPFSLEAVTLPEATRGRQRHASGRPTCSSQDSGQLAV